MNAFMTALLLLVSQAWQTSFPVDLTSLASEGEATYVVLKPAYQASFPSKDGKLVITVLDETRDIAGVPTRVVEEREWKGGDIVEVSRNYFAIDPKNGD